MERKKMEVQGKKMEGQGKSTHRATIGGRRRYLTAMDGYREKRNEGMSHPQTPLNSLTLMS